MAPVQRLLGGDGEVQTVPPEAASDHEAVEDGVQWVERVPYRRAGNDEWDARWGVNTSGTSTLRTVTVGDREIGLRYMTPDDADEMLRFARALPRHDLLFLPTDITEVEGLNDWIDSILIGTAGVILAVDDGGIVGFSSVTRNPARWVRHVAELRVVVAESMRGHHLGHHLTAEAFRIAVDLGVTRVMAQMTMDQLAAIRTFRELGFTPMAILHDHVIDDDGAAYDLLLMHQEVSSFDDTLAHLD